MSNEPSAFLMSAHDPAIPYESPNEEEFLLYRSAMLYGIARLSDEDGTREWDFSLDNLGGFMSEAGHERAAWVFENSGDPQYEDDEVFSGDYFESTADAEAVVEDLVRSGDLEWIVRDGKLCTRIANLKHVLSNPIQLGGQRYRAPEISVTIQRLDELKRMDYGAYLQTPEWRTRRDRHLEFAGHRCQICYSPSSLHVHHRTYKNRGHERTSDLIVLCSECHELFHTNSRLQK